jgi:hypothetical protein
VKPKGRRSGSAVEQVGDGALGGIRHIVEGVGDEENLSLGLEAILGMVRLILAFGRGFLLRGGGAFGLGGTSGFPSSSFRTRYPAVA